MSVCCYRYKAEKCSRDKVHVINRKSAHEILGAALVMHLLSLPSYVCFVWNTDSAIHFLTEFALSRPVFAVATSVFKASSLTHGDSLIFRYRKLFSYNWINRMNRLYGSVSVSGKSDLLRFISAPIGLLLSTFLAFPRWKYFSQEPALVLFTLLSRIF